MLHVNALCAMSNTFVELLCEREDRLVRMSEQMTDRGVEREYGDLSMKGLC